MPPGWSSSTIGIGSALPVCCSVSSSNISSSVPNPPGRQMNPRDSFISISLRVKKYFIATTCSCSVAIVFAFSSNGRRIETPRDRCGPAPSAAACMIPGPAPVTTIQPSAASAAATSRA